jgi:hypothetical protein
MILIKYEDLHSNPERTLARVADFLELKVDSSAIRNAVLNNTLSNMRLKEDRRVGKAAFAKKRELLESERLVRQGIVGGWSKRLTKQQSKLIENHAGTFLQDLGYTRDQSHSSFGKTQDGRYLPPWTNSTRS